MLGTRYEDEIEDIFRKFPILPSSEIFYFVDQPDAVHVKQRKLLYYE